jgi:hypothetical protein
MKRSSRLMLSGLALSLVTAMIAPASSQSSGSAPVLVTNTPLPVQGTVGVNHVRDGGLFGFCFRAANHIYSDGGVESKPYGFNSMKPQVRVVHPGSSGCIHDDRVSCRRGTVSPPYGQRVASGIPVSPRCAG